MRKLLFISLVAIVATSGLDPVWALSPQLINYQGRLTDSTGLPLSGTFQMQFTIYDANVAGNAIWTETHSSITVTAGLFEALLGSQAELLDTVFADTSRWLGLQIDVEPELTPRTRLASVPYANRVSTIDGATGGVISGDVDIQSDLTVSDNIGIGITNPSSALHIERSTTSLIISRSTGSHAGITLDAQPTFSAYVSLYESGVKKGVLYWNSMNNAVILNDNSVSTNVAIATNSSSQVGIGTASPISKLHVENSASTLIISKSTGSHAGIRLDARPTFSAYVDLYESGVKKGNLHWNSTNNAVVLNDASVSTNVALALHPSSNVGIGTANPTNPLEMASGAHCTAGGTWTNASSREYKTDIRPLRDSEYSAILEKLESIDVVRFKYKIDPNREHIGMIAEDVPQEISSDDKKGIPTADAIAFLMAAVKAQQVILTEQSKEIEKLKVSIENQNDSQN